MAEDTETLAELMLHADQFCSRIEVATKNFRKEPERKELRTRLGQCRVQLAHLQTAFEEDQLDLLKPSVRADFRVLIIALMWIAFYSRSAIDFRTYRMLVRIEASFTYLLICK